MSGELILVAGFCLGLIVGLSASPRWMRDRKREAARSRALVVDGRAFILTPLVPAPGSTMNLSITVPEDRA